GGHRPPELLGQLRVERRVTEDLLAGGLDLVDEEGAAGQVEGNLDERLVEGNGHRREAAHPGLVPQRLLQRLAQGEADVLDRVVGIDLEVALGRNGEVEPAVAPELGQHVGEERQPGVRRHRAGPVEVELEVDGGLAGVPVDRGGAVHRISSRASRNRSISAAVPTVTRRQPSNRGHDEQLRTSTPLSSRASQTSWPARPVGRKSTKLAPDGHWSTARRARPSTTRSRWRTISSTRSAISAS